MADVGFTQLDVTAAAGCRPWDRAREFDDEVNEEEMATASRVFRESATRTRDAHELAAVASKVQGASAQSDAVSHHDPVAGITLTTEAFQDGGSRIDEVAALINKATGRALEAQEIIKAKARELTDQFNGRLADARNEFHYLLGEFDRQVSQAPRGMKTVVVFNGKSYLGSGGEFPAGCIEAIRQHYLGLAVEDARRAHQFMTDEINEYRGDLTRIGTDLRNEGYDFTDGPHKNLWTNREQAAYYGSRLKEALHQQPPNYSQLMEAANMLHEVLGDVYNRQDRQLLNSQEINYLQAVLGVLSPDDLSRLGNLTLDSDPGRPNAVRAVQEEVANAIVALTDPAVQVHVGMDPDVKRANEQPGETLSLLPESVKAYLSGGQVHDLDESDIAVARGQVEAFNGFGKLMGHATAAPGTEFATALTESAISFQEQVSDQNEVLGDSASIYSAGREEPLVNVGSSGLLHASSLNSEAAASMMSSKPFVERMLGEHWADSAGLKEFVVSATVPPSGVHGGDYSASAVNFLDYASTHHLQILGDRPLDAMGGEIYPVDTRPLQDGLREVMAHHMKSIAGPAPENGHAQEFQLSQDHRGELFKLMARTAPEVRGQFAADLRNWELDTARQVTGIEDPRERNSLAGTIGRADGLWVNGQRDVLVENQGQAHDSRKYGLNIVKGVIGLAPGGGVITSFVPDPKPELSGLEAFDKHVAGRGDSDVRKIMAGAYSERRGIPLEAPVPGGTVETTDVHYFEGRIAEKPDYIALRNAMVEGRNRGLGM